jgi:hypothetical protein
MTYDWSNVILEGVPSKKKEVVSLKFENDKLVIDLR